MRFAAWPEIFQDRRQYPRAAEYWRMAVERVKGDEQARAQYQASIGANRRQLGPV